MKMKAFNLPETARDELIPQVLSDPMVSVICNVSNNQTFSGCNNDPNTPVLASFGAGRLHACQRQGSYDLDKMAGDNIGALHRSVRMLPLETGKITAKWDDLTFQLGPRLFVYADETRILCFADTADAAERLCIDFGKKYTKPPAEDRVGSFYLIEGGTRGFQTKLVQMSTETVLTQNAFKLHYGDKGWDWHRRFAEKLTQKQNGLSIFEGQPGTGKTYYLRHLMGELGQTHRFYYLPTTGMGMLTNPGFIEFWTEQRLFHSDKIFVVILEDSESALMTRGLDNREQVSAILNLADGMLADFLRLHIICTINCPSSEIDPALLRPGRLLCRQVFGLLNYDEAARLAERLGKTLPHRQDYSLAEVFAGEETQAAKTGRLGFAT